MLLILFMVSFSFENTVVNNSKKKHIIVTYLLNANNFKSMVIYGIAVNFIFCICVVYIDKSKGTTYALNSNRRIEKTYTRFKIHFHI